MHVEKQNLLFKYFSDTLAAIISQAKRAGRYDQVTLSPIRAPTLTSPGNPGRGNDQGRQGRAGQDSLLHQETRHWQG